MRIFLFDADVFNDEFRTHTSPEDVLPITERYLSDTQIPEAGFPFSTSWLRKRRIMGGGPTWLKIGRRVVYRESDLNRFLESCEQDNSEYAPTTSVDSGRRGR